jgi:hypothetical protein
MRLGTGRAHPALACCTGGAMMAAPPARSAACNKKENGSLSQGQGRPYAASLAARCGSEQRLWTLAAVSGDGEQQLQLQAMDAAVSGNPAIICGIIRRKL